MIVGVWQDRLSDRTDLQIKGAAGLAAAQADHRNDTVYVVHLGETTGQAQGDYGEGVINPVRQIIAARVGLVYAVSNLRDSRGKAALTDIELAREKTRLALLGWTPDDGISPAMFLSARLLQYANKVLWWEDVYQANYFIESGAN